MDALVYGQQGRRRVDQLSANECRKILYDAGIDYDDNATLAELRKAVRKLEGEE